MREDLLNAECVIQYLYNQKIISCCDDWQRQHPNDQDYSIHFNHPGTVGIIVLQIIKRAGQYYISRSRISIISSRYQFNADSIYSNCAIK